MQLMTQELEARFKNVGSQENNPDPTVIARYFFPYGQQTWYATEYDSKEKIFFGYVSLFGDHNDEWGSFALEELEKTYPFRILINNVEHKGYGKIERDLHFSEKPLSQALKADGLKQN